MLKVESFEQIQDFVRHIRSLRNGFVTNFYWDDNKHPYWLANGTLLYEQSDKGVLMVHQNESFLNLYYIATDYDVVSSMLQTIQFNDDMVADIVCRSDGEKELVAFKKMGFELYKSLYRMSHVGQIVQNDWIRDSRVKLGDKSDAVLVHQVLLRDFDPLCEQIPSIREVEDYAERGELYVIKDGDKLCGFLIAEITGVTWYLRYWYTSPDYRNQGIGARLLRTSLINGITTKRQMFWVIADNENAIKRYEHYGFSKENMNDYVMIKRN